MVSISGRPMFHWEQRGLMMMMMMVMVMTMTMTMTMMMITSSKNRVTLCELPIKIQKSSHRDQHFVPTNLLSSLNSN